LQLLIVWVVLLVGAFYLLLWRPQQRRMAAVRRLQAPGTVIHIARGAVGQRLDPEPTDSHDEHEETESE